MIYHILVYITTLLLIWIAMTVLVWPYRDKKTPLPDDAEEELIMEAWCLLKNKEEGGLLSLPTFPLIIKL